MQNTSCLGLERAGVHLLQLLVRGVECALINVIRHGEFFDAALEPRDFLFRRGDDEVDGVDVGWFGLTAHDVDVNVLWDLYVALGDGLKEG